MSQQTLSSRTRRLSKAASCLYSALVVLAATPSQATIPLSDAPLFLTVTVPPNIVLTLDDSGSMRRAYVPELPADPCTGDPSDCSVLDNRYWKSSNKNGLYYNPNVLYPVGKKADGTNLSTSFTAAYKNGFDTSLGSVDLSTNYRPNALYELKPTASVTEGFMGHFPSDMACGGSPKRCRLSNGKGGFFTTSTSCSTDAICRGLEGSGFNPVGAQAYYYVFNPGNANCSGTTAQKEVDNDCYSIVLVSDRSGSGKVDLNGDGVVNAATDIDERQNFANWFSFARTRNLAVKTATSIAFASLPNTTRVAWQALNTCRDTDNLVDTDCDGYKNDFSGISNAINTFTGTHKSNFYKWLYQLPTNSGTPLPAAMRRVGEYYTKAGENNPYDNDFSGGNSGEYACRRNYHVMFTDGIWDSNTGTTVANADNTKKPLPETVNKVSEYVPSAPYKDEWSNTLGDISLHYWRTDLRSGLDNILPPSFKDRSGTTPEDQFHNPRNDPATWQHMVNFTIGLGLTTYLKQAGLTWDGDMYSGSYDSLVKGDTNWPNARPTLNNPANVADLWHAAINSRGQFFSADDPGSLATAFQTSINAITAGAGSNAALASNSTSLNLSNTVIYQAKFNQDWSGTLVAFDVSGKGVVGQQLWDAQKLIPPAAERKIFTFNDSARKGVLFDDCGNLSDTQEKALGATREVCDDRLDWLRGDRSKEERTGNGTFRNRLNGVMGDILSSNPAYVKNIDYGYASMSGYAEYVTDNAKRTPMVYVGANDGKLYGFNASSGVEKFSYIPGAVYPRLSALTDPNYLHKYYVDGPITVGDAFLSTGWKTMLVAGLNGGGKSIYALDITNPDTFGVDNVKWEFTEADMGFSFSQPQIGVLANGQWVAVFGNGYNSTRGGAYLYIVDLDSGLQLAKIKASDTDGTDESNGLSTPTLYDSNGDQRIDTIYAGDLKGNMWKFDVSGSSAGSWGKALSGKPLFTALPGQSITSQPTVLPHPQPSATLVVFGTGRYLIGADLTDKTVQSIYGLRDADSAIEITPTTRTTVLQEQKFDLRGEVGKVGKRTVRTVTNNGVDYGTKKGYFLDLVSPDGSDPGERVTSPLLVKRGKVIITSIVPNSDPCEPGGTSNLTELSASSGGELSTCAIDVTGDLKVDAEDKFSDNRCSSSVELPVGLSNTTLYLTAGDVDGDGTVDSDAPEMKFNTGTLDVIIATAQDPLCPTCTDDEPKPAEVKRRSWIQIR